MNQLLCERAAHLQLPRVLFTEKGIIVIDFKGVERLSPVTGGEIASTFDRPDLVKLGQCELIEEIIIGEVKVRFFPPCWQCLHLRFLTAHPILRSGRW